MKRWFALLTATLFLAVMSKASVEAASERSLVSVFREGVHFSESVLPYDGGLFISNFGSINMNPERDENKGYIIYRKNGVNKIIIPSDGTLHKPTGMAIKGDFLFVCDETRLLIFSLKDARQKPQIVTFAEDDKVVNALAMDGDNLYVSITNTGRIYRLDISNPENMKNVRPQKWLEIAGPNGMAARDGTLYITTIPVDYSSVSAENVVYVVHDMENPKAEVFLNVPGLYDGAALSDDGKTLYLSDWKTASVTSVDIATKKVRVIYKESGIGPADIAQAGGTLYIPDLPNSRIIEIAVD